MQTCFCTVLSEEMMRTSGITYVLHSWHNLLKVEENSFSLVKLMSPSVLDMEVRSLFDTLSFDDFFTLGAEAFFDFIILLKCPIM